MEPNELNKEDTEKGYEVYILTGDDNGVGTKGSTGKHYVLPIVAYVIKNTGELVKASGGAIRDRLKINWEEEKGFQFGKQTIYLIKCREKGLVEEEETIRPKNLTVEEILKCNAENEQLRLILEEYNQPLTYKDEQLGEFVLDKRYNRFYGQLTIQGSECKIRLDDDYDTCIEFLRQIDNHILEFNQRVQEFIVKQLFDTAMEWNEDGPISQEDFMKSLSLYDLSIGKRGTFEMRYSCGDVFWGHHICVRGNVNGELREAMLEG